MKRLIGTVMIATLAAGCGVSNTPPETSPTPSSTAPSSTPSSPAPSSPPATPSTTATEPGTTPPPWLGTRPLPVTEGGYGEIRPTPPQLRARRFTLPDTVPMLPGTGFAVRIERAPQRVLARSTWRPACPVRADQLDWVRVTFRGFDGGRHTGELLVNERASADLVEVFRRLWRARFPIEEMRITTKAEQTAAPTGDGNDTGAFNCRPVTGGSSYSEHAYGLAIDVNPFQNPYAKGAVVLPELASSYLDRDDARPGMILPDDVVVRAFAAIGWSWGGAWRSLKDYQHFSANGR